jgi:hypothetical protein
MAIIGINKLQAITRSFIYFPNIKKALSLSDRAFI